jgi:hypothetical protein
MGLRVLISIPWTQHVEFLNDRKLRSQIIETIRKAVAKNAGHPQSLPISSETRFRRRWSAGSVRSGVTEFLEKLIAVARETDPRPLYSYASYPPTEYLLPAERRFL